MRRKRRLPAIATVLALLLAPCVAGIAQAGGPEQQALSAVKADQIVVLKGSRTLWLLRAGQVVQSFRVALGPDPRGHKRAQGDGRTPEGRYVIDGRNPESKFYRSLHISYPNEEDRAMAEAAGRSPGGQIMIHGLPNGLEIIGQTHARSDWTEGCIAVTNEEIDILWHSIEDGTPIDILP
ncbi:MAG: murein L,D-transpeptidase family protein [Kiloniellales bacterium]